MRNHTHLTALVLAAFAFACNGEDKDDEDTDTDDDNGGTTQCVGLASSNPTIPAAATNDFFYRGQMSVRFAGDANAVGTTIELKDGSGADVALTTIEWEDSGDTAFFGPAAPLDPSSDYTLVVQTDCPAAAEIAFSTSSFGEQVSNTSVLAGTAFDLDIAGADIVRPPGIGGLLGTLLGQLGDTAIVIVVKDLNENDEIDFYGGIGDKDAAGNITQDICEPTFSLGDAATPAVFENPYFELNAPDGITISAAGVDITLDAVLLSGAFSADGKSVGGVRLAGQADARTLAPALEDLLDVGGAAEVCSLIGSFGVACEPCDTDGEAFCLTLDAQNIVADAVEGLDFIEVDEDNLDESCEEDEA